MFWFWIIFSFNCKSNSQHIDDDFDIFDTLLIKCRTEIKSLLADQNEGLTLDSWRGLPGFSLSRASGMTSTHLSRMKLHFHLKKKRNQLQFTLVTRQNPGNLEKSACLQISRPVNPLTPRSDWHVTSPYSIYTLSINEVVRLTWLIRYKILSWLNTKFS